MKPTFWQFFKSLISLWAAPAVLMAVIAPPAAADTSWARQKPMPKAAATKPTLDKAFVFHGAALAGTTAFDLTATSRVLDYSRSFWRRGDFSNPRACHEANPFYGSNPSDGRLALRGGALFAGQIAASFLLKKATRNNSHRWVREAWRVPMTYLTIEHIAFGARNLAACGS